MAAPGYVNTLRSDGTVQMAAYGASCPFPWVLANVSSANRRQPFAAGTGPARHDRHLLTTPWLAA